MATYARRFIASGVRLVGGCCGTTPEHGFIEFARVKQPSRPVQERVGDFHHTHVAYPADPEALSDEEWARFLFFRDNSRGRYAERWNHSAGCRRWFNVARDSVTHEITAAYPMGAASPADTGR